MQRVARDFATAVGGILLIAIFLAALENGRGFVILFAIPTAALCLITVLVLRGEIAARSPGSTVRLASAAGAAIFTGVAACFAWIGTLLVAFGRGGGESPAPFFGMLFLVVAMASLAGAAGIAWLGMDVRGEHVRRKGVAASTAFVLSAAMLALVVGRIGEIWLATIVLLLLLPLVVLYTIWYTRAFGRQQGIESR